MGRKRKREAAAAAASAPARVDAAPSVELAPELMDELGCGSLRAKLRAALSEPAGLSQKRRRLIGAARRLQEAAKAGAAQPRLLLRAWSDARSDAASGCGAAAAAAAVKD